LVIEDTWVSGGHAQSVAAALKKAGAAKVSILAIARWLDMDDPRTRRIYHDALDPRPYDPTVCPWLHEPCRSPNPIHKAERSTPPPPPPRPRQPTTPRSPMRCSLHGITLDGSGRCDACTKLVTPPTATHDAPPQSERRKKPWWQFW
jgi:hypothetical protein